MSTTSSGKLKGKRALVTAGAQGIGLAISRGLAQEGCDVFVHYRSSAGPAESFCAEAKALGVRAGSTAGDLTKSEECDRVVAEAVDFLGGLDVLINNAGSLVARHSLADATEAFWDEVMSLNVGSARRISRAAIPHLAKAAETNLGASVVNLSSLAGRKGGHAGSLPYSTAKGAILTLTRAMATELGPQGIRVNAVTPGLILGTSFHNTHTTEESKNATIAGIPLGRGGSPEDIARAVVYLASEYDGFITGATLDINGGVYMA